MSNKKNANVAEFKQKTADFKQKMVEQGGYFFITPEHDGFAINTDDETARADLYKLITSYAADKQIQVTSFEPIPDETK